MCRSSWLRGLVADAPARQISNDPALVRKAIRERIGEIDHIDASTSPPDRPGAGQALERGQGPHRNSDCRRHPTRLRDVPDGGATRIRRIVAVDAEWPRLTIDAGGLIQPGALGSTRLSDPKKAARNYGPIPEAHQLHHIVPDEVVKTHALFEQARTRGKPPYDLDHRPNLIALPENRIAQIKADSTGLPLHNGSHPDYSKEVRKICAQIGLALVTVYGDLNVVPSEALAKAAHKAEGLARDLLGKSADRR